MTEKNCIKGTVVPTVDNSEVDCQDCGYVNDMCIIMTQAIPYLGVQANDSFKTFITKFINDYKTKASRIRTLENEIKTLKSRLDELEAPV